MAGVLLLQAPWLCRDGAHGQRDSATLPVGGAVVDCLGKNVTQLPAVVSPRDTQSSVILLLYVLVNLL